MLLSAMGCASVCCGLLNLFLLWRGVPGPGSSWEPAMWVWLVPPPLCCGRCRRWFSFFSDLLAVGGLLVLISAATHGQSWLVGIALPVWAGFSLLFADHLADRAQALVPQPKPAGSERHRALPAVAGVCD